MRKGKNGGEERMEERKEWGKKVEWRKGKDGEKDKKERKK